jgi:hypothetical protein
LQLVWVLQALLLRGNAKIAATANASKLPAGINSQHERPDLNKAFKKKLSIFVTASHRRNCVTLPRCFVDLQKVPDCSTTTASRNAKYAFQICSARSFTYMIKTSWHQRQQGPIFSLVLNLPI